MKAVWSWICAGLAIACTSPQKGAERGLWPDDAGGVPVEAGPRQLTCGDVVCDPNATCSGVGGAAKCACGKGYEGDGQHCTDIDECKDPKANDCDVNAACTNRPGRYLCTCKDGYVGDGKTCSGVNECQGVANTCDPNAVCVDRTPSFGCECKPGFTGDDTFCNDVNECAKPDLFSCAQNAHCTNTYGGYGCTCNTGFTGDGNVACRSLCDVARTDASVCASSGLCRVDGLKAVCDACEPGSTGDGKTCHAATCPAQCDGAGTDDAAHTICTSTGTCACAPGYQGAPGSCTDVDECATNDGGCGASASCTNTDGGHLCACKPGYARDASGACTDIDECKASPFPCHPDATCTNTAPDANGIGFTCACKPGFEGDGLVCKDVDECATNNGGCGKNAACVNQRGGSSCECRAPLVGDAKSCHCDLTGLWAMRQDLDTCWKGRPLLEGTDQDLISAGHMEASVWELQEITYDGSQMKVRRKGCGSDNTPDLISPLFRETYSSYVPLALFDRLGLQGNDVWKLPGIVPGGSFTTPSTVALVGIDLGPDPFAPWPKANEDVQPSQWLDTDEDGEPGLTFWPHLPSELTDTGASHYSYLPARPAVTGSSLYIDQRAGCVSVAARVITHLEAQVDDCTHFSGTVVNEKTEGRVHSCTLVDKGTCDPANLNKCSGWAQDIQCNAADWKAMGKCLDTDVDRLDADENQNQDSKATFELVRIGNVGDGLGCSDVRNALPAVDHSTPTITCTTPP